jgi:NOL1/NOP2/sun family putative RNA methylase
MQYLRKPLVPSFRINTLKANREKILSLLSDLRIRQLPFYYEGFSVEGKYRLGNHMTHNLGLIYVQEAASMMPVILLDPQPGEVVMDLCAAPGSKTTQIAQLMANKGLLVVNEVNRKRMRGLIHNIKRCGLMNEAVIGVNGQKVHRVFSDYFDRVLIDAPCSAEGTVRKSKAVLYHWGIKNIQRMSRLQIGLITSGFRALRPGGIMVYSTCTIAPEENEMVLSYLLEKYPEAELLPVKIPKFKTRPGIVRWQGVSFDARVKNCARILPQDNDTAPFFVAKITKRGMYRPRMKYLGKVDFDGSAVANLAERFGVDQEQFKTYAVFKQHDTLFISTHEVFSFWDVKSRRKGLEFGKVYDRELKPDNDLVQLCASNATKNVVDMKEWQVKKFLKGEVMKTGRVPGIEKGFVIVRYGNLPLGIARYNGSEMKSAVKRERRVM